MNIVQCVICGKFWNAMDPGIHYRSLDLRWECTDRRPCHDRAIARTTDQDRAAMQRALDDSWAALEANGWRI